MSLDFIPAWANVIAQREGYNSPSSRPARNHNPGDLKFAGQGGSVGADSGGFAVFPDDVSGWQALYRQLTKYVSDFPSFSILDITAHYLGQSTPTINAQGNAFSYAAAVAGALGVDISTTLGELASGGPGPTLPIPAGLTDTTTLPADVMGLADQPGLFSTGEIVGIVAVIGLLAYLAWNA